MMSCIGILSIIEEQNTTTNLILHFRREVIFGILSKCINYCVIIIGSYPLNGKWYVERRLADKMAKVGTERAFIGQGPSSAGSLV